ncbi:hypothetical protein FRB90_007581, partial [Tulasnella sp. 427]
HFTHRLDKWIHLSDDPNYCSPLPPLSSTSPSLKVQMADPSIRSYSPDPTLVSAVVMPSTQNLNSQQPQDGNERDGLAAAQQDEPGVSRVPSIREGAEGPTAEPVVDAAEPTPVPATPKVSITLLLVSGRRRTVEFEKQTTVGELKEIVWSTWPGDWSDELPPSASFLRILYLGRILTDETILSSLNLAEPPDATVMHVSVRSFAPTSNDDVKKPKKRGSRRGRSSSGADGAIATGARGDGDETDNAGGCCCVIC